jgi:hypothetical protein
MGEEAKRRCRRRGEREKRRRRGSDEEATRRQRKGVGIVTLERWHHIQQQQGGDLSTISHTPYTQKYRLLSSARS